MRAALLPTPGNVPMLRYWLANYATWSDYVDELVVCVNGADPDDADEIRAMVEAAGGLVLWMPWRIGHDGALVALLAATEADLVVLCEDDAYVRAPDEIRRSFALIEEGYSDIVGSPRHEDYASSPLQVWPELLTNDKEELRRGFWPAFLFARRDDLIHTDQRYGDQRWAIGEMVTGWRPVTAEDCAYVGIAPDYIHLDTLFGTTFQLRARGLRIDLVHHVRLFDAEATEEWLAEDPPWFHITGLSTLDQLDWPLDRIPDYGPGGGLWTRRLAWWNEVGIDVEPYLDRMDIDEGEFLRWMQRFHAWAPAMVPA